METTSSSTFPISVTSELGKNISVPVSLDDTVLDLNMKLFAMDSCFYPSQSRLVHDGQRLMNEQTLRHYNITSNSSIQQFHKSRGGGSAALEGKEDVSVRGGGSAALEGKEDVSATDNQERIYQADSSRSSSMVILHGGSAHADLTIETKSLLAGITSTSVEELQKRPQSDVPAQERSCRCVRQEFERVKPEVDAHILKEQNVYKACLPGPGIFQCSETGLAFEVESAASIVYRYANWSMHLKEADQNLWEPAGPLFNIWALPGTVRAVYLPHFICVSACPSFLSGAYPGPAYTGGHSWTYDNIFLRRDSRLRHYLRHLCGSLYSLAFFYPALPSSNLSSCFIKYSQCSLPHHLLCTHTTAFSSPSGFDDPQRSPPAVQQSHAATSSLQFSEPRERLAKTCNTLLGSGTL
ncbi:uncharacterized protein LOC107321358 isoform X3 [Coturnix japonica]|uniref:uncharacterized protein LOC107321358 isoform X3 n=1 Tax=Coturnix japonica TaxID=93934 RepID=UPI0013A5EB27|nr:uncharacterized protein LOC107321358 isoform X3 [Coturnix japonica]